MVRTVVVFFAFILAFSLFSAQVDFRDDFSASELDDVWEWYTPHLDAAGEPYYELDEEFFTMGFPAGDYDSWIGFDRMPRLRMQELELEEDFRIETSVSVELPTVPGYYQTGLWVELVDQAGGPLDGWFYGFYSRPGWVGSHTIRVERAGNRNSGSFGDNFPAPWETADACLKIERVGDLYTFFYKELEEDSWQVFHSAEAPGEMVTHVGVFAKNWATPKESVRAHFDYFALGDPESIAPVIDAVTEKETALVGLEYSRGLTISEGFPLPEWSLSVTPPPATAPEIDANGLITWIPSSDDSGKTFAFEATATNIIGSDTASWEVEVKNEIVDEFEEEVLMPGFEFHTPQTGPVLEFIDGTAQIHVDLVGDDGENYDTWTGFDRMPRIRTPFATDGDFVVETTLNLYEPLTVQSFQTGIWISFTGSSSDGFMWGLYTQAQQLRVERTGTNNPDSDTMISGAEDLGLRVERRGDEFYFYYREGVDGEWIQVWKQSFVAEIVDYVGLACKTWGAATPVTVAYDYFSVRALDSEPPVLKDPCPDGMNFATPEAPFAKALSYVPGFPGDTEVSVDGPGEFDPETGLFSFIPEEAGEMNVTVIAETAGFDPVSVSFDVCVLDAPPYEDFTAGDIEDLEKPWERYNPGGIAPVPFFIEDTSLRIAVPAGASYDHWSTVDAAPQFRIRTEDEPALEGNWIIETRMRLAAYASGSQFHAGLCVGFGNMEIFYWGIYNGEHIELERSGLNHIIVIQEFAETVTFRIQRFCNTLYFYYQLDGDEMRYAGKEDFPWPASPDILWTGAIVKTYGAGAQVTCDFEYFDIIQSDTCQSTNDIAVFTGDANGDNGVNLADAISILSYYFSEGAVPPCFKGADVNDDEGVNLADAIGILSYYFTGGSMIAPDGTPIIPGEDGCRLYASELIETLGCESPCNAP